jgi:hypothetical protein
MTIELVPLGGLEIHLAEPIVVGKLPSAPGCRSLKEWWCEAGGNRT